MYTQNAKIGRIYPRTASSSTENEASLSTSSTLNEEMQFSKSFQNRS